MSYLPKLPYSEQRRQSQILQFRGMNLTDNYPLGSVRESENITTDRFPYIASRNARGAVEGEHNTYVSSLFNWDELVKVSGFVLYIGDERVADPQGLIGSAEKQFAVVNTKLVIFPEKVYIDMSERDKVIRPLANTAIGTGGIVFNATDGVIAIPAVDEGDFSLFGANNALYVSGCVDTENNTVSKYTRISGVESYGATSSHYTSRSADGTRKAFPLSGKGASHNFVENVWLIDADNNREPASGWTFDFETHTVNFSTAPASGYKVEIKSKPGAVVLKVDTAYTPVYSGTEGANVKVTFERDIPQMDYICASENRVWGCSNKTQTIYASSLGDPTTFYAYSGVDTDSYAVAVGTDGDFTGCAAYSSSVLFFKEECLHKVLGGYPSQYQIYTYNLNGVKKGCHKSILNVNDTLFYVSLHGVCTYTGGGSSVLSSALGDISLSGAAAGSDGEHYYLSAKTADKWNLWTFSLKTNMWVREDDTEVIAFTTIGRTVYGIKNRSVIPSMRYGDIFILDGGEPIDKDTPWSLTFTPFYETVSGSYNAQSSIFAKKRYGRMHLRVELPKDSYIVASVRMDDGRWSEAGRIVGQASGVYMMTVPIKTCDKCELKLEGKGSFCILNMQRFYTIGSER